VTVPQRPRISILMPCRDAEPFLEACIASLGAQTEPRYEVLVLDDGSTDRTAAILSAWVERDPRVRWFDPDGRGIVAALRRLASEARAPMLARMDADDRADETRFAEQLTYMREHPEIAACGTGVRYTPRPAPDSGYLRYERWINSLTRPELVARDLFVECPIAHPTLMVRRAAFQSVGGYRQTAGPEDYDLILRLAEAGYALSNVPSILHEWRLGDHRLSERSARYSAAAFRDAKIQALSRGLVPTDRPLVIWGAGKVGKAFARAWQAHGGTSRITAFVDLDPRKIGQTIHGAHVISPSDLLAVGPAEWPPYTLIAVGSPGARGDIREALEGSGLAESGDFRAVA